jgi:hypothetical protein
MKTNSLAIEYAQRALKLNSKNGFAYCTLAEAYASFDEENFYKNIELAMKFGYPVWEHHDDPAYDRFVKQDRFVKLMKKYKK